MLCGFVLKGYRWIRNMELENDIKISEMNNPNLMRIIENCIRLGLPVMIYNVQETLDPSLEPILLQQIFMQVSFFFFLFFTFVFQS